MRRRLSAALFFTIAALFLFAFFSLHLSRSAIARTDLIHHYPVPGPASASDHRQNLVIDGQSTPGPLALVARHVSSIRDSISTLAVLLPAWEILLIVSPETPLSDAVDDYVCVFQNNDTSAARFAGILPSTNRTALYCQMPNGVKRLRPFLQPVLSRKSQSNQDSPGPTAPELIRWTFLVYESFSTEDDVVLFAKGLNNRQGVNRPPSEFRCVFGDASKNDAVKTAVTSSTQEVFRCPHPDSPALNNTTKISLLMVEANVVVPSVAMYTRNDDEAWVPRNQQSPVTSCARARCDDDLGHVVKQLNEEGFNVTTTFWIWPKTQEAGFSHAAVYAKSWCKWMMYIDVDEFVFAPSSWSESPTPGKHMLKSLLPKHSKIGQVSIRCNEFGPSNQKTHPSEGVTQGYTCRRRFEQRHKSIVLLEAVEHSLLNVIHHFHIKQQFRSKQLSMNNATVNHYKYQAWPEFQNKFRRRVSAYVLDWTQR
ncbi:hypothetical protein M0R45_025523 [Rubus argutus]|uniref:Glycosyltransferase family 92 protein n=1 Tax=Rubus argutus TaxID=59490 RepID=A0AAW1WWQ2_RUBAR